MKRFLALFVLASLLLVIGVTSVFAGSVALSGTFGAGDPTLPVVTISTPNCASQGSTQVHYHTYLFNVTVSGGYSFTSASTGGRGTLASFYLMTSAFNPAAPLASCIAASNRNPAVVNNFNLTAGVLYYFIVFDDTLAQTTPGYTASITGPGDIIFGGVVVNACTYPLPPGSFVYSVPAGAPVFYDAKLDTQLNWNLPAGTWWISEFKGDFAKVWISCQGQPIYIPANAVQR